MITYIEGKLVHKEAAYAIIEAGGLGYHINISLTTFSDIKDEEKCKLHTHLHVKEDSHTLYGFSSLSERGTFLKLINISGIGPSTALVMLSSLSPEDLRQAIITEDVRVIQSIKGIGGKTAQRIILELKDKMLKDSGGFETTSSTVTGSHNTVRNEALQALTTLGIPRATAEKNINKVLKQLGNTAKLEDLIREALKTA